MKKLYIALQEPEVRIQVESAKDSTGKSAKLWMTFKRHGSTESDVLLNQFSEIANKTISDADLLTTATEVLPGLVKAFEISKATELRNFIKTQITALENVPLTVQTDDGKLETFKVADTRTAQDDEELWGAGSNCLNFLLDILLDSNPWSSSITSAMHSVLYNVQLGNDAAIKN